MIGSINEKSGIQEVVFKHLPLVGQPQLTNLSWILIFWFCHFLREGLGDALLFPSCHVKD